MALFDFVFDMRVEGDVMEWKDGAVWSGWHRSRDLRDWACSWDSSGWSLGGNRQVTAFQVNRCEAGLNASPLAGIFFLQQVRLALVFNKIKKTGAKVSAQATPDLNSECSQRR